MSKWCYDLKFVRDYILKYNELSDSEKWLVGYYFNDIEYRIEEDIQEYGFIKCGNKAFDMLSKQTDKKIHFCWYCGEIEFFDKDADSVDFGWLKNVNVRYSGYICPECAKDKEIVNHFIDTNKALSSLEKIYTHNKTSVIQDNKELIKERIRTLVNKNSICPTILKKI